jgi:predicted nucleotidyltransferase
MPRPESRSFIRYPLDEVFSAGSHVRVLRWLARHRQPMATSQLARQSGLAIQSVRNALAALAAQGLVSTLGEGRSQVHGLRFEHPVAGLLEHLFRGERDRWATLQQRLREALADVDGVEGAWLYGSVARGEDGPQSDLDLLVVLGDAHAAGGHPDRLRDALSLFGEREGVAVSPVIVSRATLRELPATSPGWWADIVRDATTLLGPHPAAAAAQAAAAAAPA